MRCTFHGVGLGLVVLLLSGASAQAQEDAIPTDGLELWVKADGPMTVTNGQVSQWTDLSSKGNHAIHDAFGQAAPTVATANGQPTMRFSGVYTGFHFTQVTTIRTVFAVLSKVSTSCLPTLPNYGTSAKFWIGGNALPTFFHPEHGCCIYNTNLSEVSPYLVNGKTYLNGKSVDGRTTQFPLDQLGLLSIVSTANVSADTIARDRSFQDRSWQGDISELIIYSTPLDDATRVSIENILAKKYAIAAAGGGNADGGAGDAAAGGAGGAGGTAGRSGGVADAGGGRSGAGAGAGGSTGGGGGEGAGGSTGGGAGGGTGGGGGTGAGGGAGAGAGGGGGTGATGGADSVGSTASAGMGGTLGSGGNTGGTSAAGKISDSAGATGTGEVTGGASADAAVGGTSTGVGVSRADKSSGCAYGGTRSGDDRILGLFVLLVAAVALFPRTHRRQARLLGTCRGTAGSATQSRDSATGWHHCADAPPGWACPSEGQPSATTAEQPNPPQTTSRSPP
jgi:hypothetical protein